jgi:hypothetical protein
MRQLKAICTLIVAALCAGTARAQIATEITSDGTAFHVFTGTSDFLRVQSNGFAGIGTSTPGVLLDLKGSNQAYGGQLRLQGTDFDQITFYNSANPAQNATNRLGFIYYDVVNHLLGLENQGGGKFILLNQDGGSVGIGTANPTATLAVLSPTAGSFAHISLGRTGPEARLGINGGSQQFALDASVGDAILRVDSASQRLLLLAGSGNAVMTITSANVGIGTTTPASKLEIGPPNYPVQFQDMSSQGVSGIKLNIAGSGEIDVAGLQIGSLAMPVVNTTSGPLYLQSSAGDVVIGGGTGSGAHGNLTVNGTVYANYQDVAEWVPAAESMIAGTVVVISDETSNTVTPSTRPYDTGVAGVVSPTPGLLLGTASASKAKIATTGRVKVRVDASNNPIRKGDLLVTSDTPGVAMKSEPLNLAGVKIHRPGTLIGKALEPLPSGQGEILVLLSLQ